MLGTRVDATLPAAISFVGNLTVAPVVTDLLRKAVKARYADKQDTKVPFGRRSGSLASLVYQYLDLGTVGVQVVLNPIIGVLFLPHIGHNFDIVMVMYFVTDVVLLYTLRAIWKLTPNKYVIDGTAANIPLLGKVLKRVPWIRRQSWGAMACAIPMLIVAIATYVMA